jgi:hypothetical protein
MNIQKQFSQQDIDVRRVEYDDSVTFVADVGDSEATVDVVGDTVIVVAGGQQFDLELDGVDGDAQAFMKNGVLTIEVQA